MKSINSVSGGKTSAYISANYPADYNLFALVRIEDQAAKFPDPKIRQEVEDRIQKPFIATAEDDVIIYTMLDLEQFIGKKITWVSGITYDEVVKYKGGWLPNKLHRYCTTEMKLKPMFEWWLDQIAEPVEMRIGFRANELARAERMQNKLVNGLLQMDASFDVWETGPNKGKRKWEKVSWQKPVWPLIEDRIYKDNIESFWTDKPVRFAELNNCVGCFHRNPLLLRKMYDAHPEKMEWFRKQEGGKNGFWRSDTNYTKIKNYQPQIELKFDMFGECDSGHCGY